MPNSNKTPTRPGQRVAHVALDDPQGGARAGVVKEYVGDEKSGVVIMRGDDGSQEGFDRREVVPIHHIALVSRGPVLLHPRHLWALLRRPWGLLSVILAVVLAAWLVDFSQRYHWSHALIIGVGVVMMLVVAVLVLADQHLLHRNKQ